MFLLQKRLKHIKLMLKEWNKKEFGNIFDGKQFVEGKMQKLNQTLIREGFDKDRNEQAINISKNGRTSANKMRFFEGKNPECNG